MSKSLPDGQLGGTSNVDSCTRRLFDGSDAHLPMVQTSEPPDSPLENSRQVLQRVAKASRSLRKTAPQRLELCIYRLLYGTNHHVFVKGLTKEMKLVRRCAPSELRFDFSLHRWSEQVSCSPLLLPESADSPAPPSGLPHRQELFPNWEKEGKRNMPVFFRRLVDWTRTVGRWTGWCCV